MFLSAFITSQAAYVEMPGEVLAQSMTESGQYGTVSASDKVLFITFTSDEDQSTSAMCTYHPEADSVMDILC